MKYNQLGQTELQVSEIGFGCMSLQGSPKENAQLLLQALDKGVTFFDTADLYQHGENEKAVGKALKAHRAKVIIATKVGNQWRPDGSGWDWNPSKQYILQAVEQSLTRLQTDYIDLYQLHGGTIEDNLDETIEAFELLKQQGKIKYYGISSIRPNVIKAYAQHSSIASVMLQYSLLDRRPEEEILPYLQAQQIGVIARGSLAQGILGWKAAKSYISLTEEQVLHVQQQLEQLAENQQTPASLALKYVVNQPTVSTAIVGIRTPAHLANALEVAAAAPLTALQVQKLSAAAPLTFYEQYR